MNIVIGCDFHKRDQVIAMLDRTTGEIVKRRLQHIEEAERYYRSLPPGCVVGMETTCRARWFERLLRECGHELLIGHAQKIRAMQASKQKNDDRDAAHLLDLLCQGKFPAVWQPSEEVRDARCLILHRHTLVRMRTRLNNQLAAMARSEGMLEKVSSRKGRCALEGLALTGWQARRRQELLELYDSVDGKIGPLEGAIAQMAESDEAARRLQQHPGVGPVTAVYFPLVVGDPGRFPTAGHVPAYLGLLPAEDSSGPRRRWGPITRQGNRLARFLLVEAGQAAARSDPEFRRFYERLARSKGRPKAKIAVARKLAVRLFLLYQSGMEYAEWRAQSRVRMQAQPD